VVQNASKPRQKSIFEGCQKGWSIIYFDSEMNGASKYDRLNILDAQVTPWRALKVTQIEKRVLLLPHFQIFSNFVELVLSVVEILCKFFSFNVYLDLLRFRKHAATNDNSVIFAVSREIVIYSRFDLYSAVRNHHRPPLEGKQSFECNFPVKQ
jgi:hypothetical protein